MDFTLVQLEHFVAVATDGSMTRAAQRLHMSQSALSASLAKLERELRSDLFVRIPARPITLSPAGRQFLTEARTLLRVARETYERGAGLGAGTHGVLAVGCFSPLVPVCLPQAMGAARRGGHATAMRLIEGTTTELRRALHAGECELAASYLLSPAADLTFDEVGEVHPHVIVSTDHPLAARAVVTLRELAQHPWVMYRPELPTQQLMEFMFLREGVSPPPAVSVSSYEAMRGLVAEGEGFALLTVRPASNITYTGRAVVPLELAGELMPIKLGIFTVPGSTPTHRARTFSGYLRGVLADHVRRSRTARMLAGLEPDDSAQPPSPSSMSGIDDADYP